MLIWGLLHAPVAEVCDRNIHIRQDLFNDFYLRLACLKLTPALEIQRTATMQLTASKNVLQVLHYDLPRNDVNHKVMRNDVDT